MDSFKEVLKQLYRIHLSHTPIPIERFIVNVMDEIPVPDRQGQLQVLHEIGNIQVPFHRAVDQYPPAASRADIEYLFRALNAEQVIDIFLALLLEKKVLLISKYKALLTHASIALISFLFPLKWKFVLIPILPKEMTDVLDAPVPFLIGIDPLILKDDQSFEIPNEVYRVDLDMGFISLRDAKPKLPSKDYKTLKTRLQKATEGIERPSPLLEQVDQAFNVVSYQDEQDDDEGGEVDEEGNPVRQYRFNEYEIRDAFLEFMTSIMSGYTKCLVSIPTFCIITHVIERARLDEGGVPGLAGLLRLQEVPHGEGRDQEHDAGLQDHRDDPLRQLHRGALLRQERPGRADHVLRRVSKDSE